VPHLEGGGVVKIRAFSVGVYRGDRGPTEISVAAQLEDEALGHGVWRQGQAIRIEATGDASRESLLALLNAALDRLEKGK